MIVWLALVACSGSDDADDKGDTDVPSDADTDTDTDSDSDADTDTDTDSDADADTAETGTTETADTAATTSSLVGQAYRFDPTTVVVNQPVGLGALLLAQWTTPFMLEITGETATTIDFRLAVSDGAGSQDLCVETIDLPGGDYTVAPNFAFSGVATTIDVLGISATVESGSFSGMIDTTNDVVRQVRFAGQFDTVPMVPLILGYAGPDEAVCDLVAAFGVSCVPCASGISLYCLPYESVDSVAQLDPALSTVPRTAADIAADPVCN